MDIIGGILEIIDLIGDVKDFILGIGEQVSEVKNEITDVFVQGGTEVIGLADAISEPVEVSKGFLGAIFPTEVVVMFGIAFTIVIALAMRRSTNA